MTRKSRPFQELLLEQLSEPEVAKYYLNDALDESPEAFLEALKTVAEAKQMAKRAKEAGIQPGMLDHSPPNLENPSEDTLSSILKSVGLNVSIQCIDEVGFIPISRVGDIPAHPQKRASPASYVGYSSEEPTSSSESNFLSIFSSTQNCGVPQYASIGNC